MSRKSRPPIALYSALADTTRCRILEILKTAPTPVHVLTEAFSISRPAISRHLRVLKAAGLVAEVKKGRENVYAFRPAKLDPARTWLEAIRASGEVNDAAPVEEAPPAPEPVKTPKKKPVAKVAKPAKDPPPAPTPAPAPQTPPASQMGFDF